MGYTVKTVDGELKEYAFDIGGVLALRNFTATTNGNRLIIQSQENANFTILDALVNEVEIDGVVYDDVVSAQEALQRLVFNPAIPTIITKELRDLIFSALQPNPNGSAVKFFNEKGELVVLDLSKKVDKVIGKQLSSNDFTDAEKQKLEGLVNYVLPHVLANIEQNDVNNWNDAKNKKISAFSITGDKNKVAKITLEDGTLLKSDFAFEGVKIFDSSGVLRDTTESIAFGDYHHYNSVSKMVKLKSMFFNLIAFKDKKYSLSRITYQNKNSDSLRVFSSPFKIGKVFNHPEKQNDSFYTLKTLFKVQLAKNNLDGFSEYPNFKMNYNFKATNAKVFSGATIVHKLPIFSYKKTNISSDFSSSEKIEVNFKASRTVISEDSYDGLAIYFKTLDENYNVTAIAEKIFYFKSLTGSYISLKDVFFEYDFDHSISFNDPDNSSGLNHQIITNVSHIATIIEFF